MRAIEGKSLASLSRASGAVRMVAVLGDLVGHVVDRDDSVEERDEDENQQPQGEVVEERVEVHVAREKKSDTEDEDHYKNGRGGDPLADPEPASKLATRNAIQLATGIDAVPTFTSVPSVARAN